MNAVATMYEYELKNLRMISAVTKQVRAVLQNAMSVLSFAKKVRSLANVVIRSFFTMLMAIQNLYLNIMIK